MATACLIITNCKKCTHYSTAKVCPQSRMAICEKIGKRIQIEIKKGRKIVIPEWCPNKLVD